MCKYYHVPILLPSTPNPLLYNPLQQQSATSLTTANLLAAAQLQEPSLMALLATQPTGATSLDPTTLMLQPVVSSAYSVVVSSQSCNA